MQRLTIADGLLRFGIETVVDLGQCHIGQATRKPALSSHKAIDLAQHPAAITAYRPLGVVGNAMIIYDYIAIGVLMVLIVWAAADWVPRGKL